MTKKSQYEVTVYDTVEQKFIYEKTSDSFIAAAPQVLRGDDGKDFHDVHLVVANLHPKVAAEICLALIQKDPAIKKIFVDTVKKMNESEGE